MDGTPFSLEFRGEADVACMNACGYDFGTLGNHEFSNPLDEVLRLVRMGRFQTVCANLRYRDSGEPLVPPYVRLRKSASCASRCSAWSSPTRRTIAGRASVWRCRTRLKSRGNSCPSCASRRMW
jgi:hypothetical protein